MTSKNVGHASWCHIHHNLAMHGISMGDTLLEDITDDLDVVMSRLLILPAG